MSVECFELIKLATQCGLEFAELLRFQSGHTPFDIAFNIWIYGTELKARNAGRHIELQRGKGHPRATARHCRLELADRSRSSCYCFI